jgi:hypothetical protein
VLSVMAAVADVCRKTIVKLKISSSSFERRRRNEGGCELGVSGSCIDATSKLYVRVERRDGAPQRSGRSHLDVVYRRIVTYIALCHVSRRGIFIGRYRE